MGGVGFIFRVERARFEGVDAKPGDKRSLKLGDVVDVGEAMKGGGGTAGEHKASRRNVSLTSSRTSSISMRRA
jgi:hypothetical protein